MIKQMKYFQAVVRCGNFTEAAEECFISQSAISQQMHALEKELGVELLERKPRKITLTPAGEYFYKKSLVLVSDFERLVKETARLGEGAGYTLSVGYLRHYHGRELSRAVTAFGMEYPDVSLNLVMGTHEELYDALRTDKIDMAFSDLRRSPSEHYVNYSLAKSFFYAALPASNPLAQLEAVTMDDLKNTPCILVSSKEQESVEEVFYREYLGMKSEAIFVGTVDEACLMTILGRGYMLTDFTGTPENDTTLAYIPILRNGRKLHRKYYAFWRVEAAEKHIEPFAALLKKQFSQESENGSENE